MSRSAGPAVDLFGALAGLGEPAGGVPAKTLMRWRFAGRRYGR